jgi:hypothetical protein
MERNLFLRMKLTRWYHDSIKLNDFKKLQKTGWIAAINIERKKIAEEILANSTDILSIADAPGNKSLLNHQVINH